MPQTSFLVNRWLTVVIVAHEADIVELIRKRDPLLDVHTPPMGVVAREDNGREIVSELYIGSSLEGSGGSHLRLSQLVQNGGLGVDCRQSAFGSLQS